MTLAQVEPVTVLGLLDLGLLPKPRLREVKAPAPVQRLGERRPLGTSGVCSPDMVGASFNPPDVTR